MNICGRGIGWLDRAKLSPRTGLWRGLVASLVVVQNCQGSTPLLRIPAPAAYRCLAWFGGFVDCSTGWIGEHAALAHPCARGIPLFGLVWCLRWL
jgi:hypothetical protein